MNKVCKITVSKSSILFLSALTFFMFSCGIEQEQNTTVEVSVNLIHSNGSNTIVPMGIQGELQNKNERTLSNSFTIEEVFVREEFYVNNIQLLDSDRFCYSDVTTTKVVCESISTGKMEYHGAGKGKGPAELEGIQVFGVSERGSALLYDRGSFLLKGVLNDEELFMKPSPMNTVLQIANFGDFSILSQKSRVDSATVSLINHLTAETKPLISNFQSLHGAQPAYSIIIHYYHIGKIDDDHFYSSNMYTGHFSLHSISSNQVVHRMLIDSVAYTPPDVYQRTTFPGGPPELNRNNYQFDQDKRPNRKYSYSGSSDRHIIFCQYINELQGFYFDHYDAKTGDYVTSFYFKPPVGGTVSISFGHNQFSIVSNDGSLRIFRYSI